MDKDKDKEVVIPFTMERQAACLYYMLTNGTFFQKARGQIGLGWWSNPNHQLIHKTLLEFVERYGKFPVTLPDFTDSLLFQAIDPAKRLKLHGEIGLAQERAKSYSFEVMVKDVDSWIKSMILFDALKVSADMYNKNNYLQAISELTKAVKEYQEVRFLKDDEEDFGFESLINDFGRADQDRQGALTTGCRLLDRRIDPTCPDGCLLRGDTTMILAASNVGKTSTLITMIASNLFRGKNVIFVTHEGRTLDLKEKIRCSVMNMTKSEIMTLMRSTDDADFAKMKTMHDAVGRLSNHLTYIPMNRPGLTVEEVIATIQEKNSNRKMKMGAGYDLVVCDYPAKLSLGAASGKKNMDYRTVQYEIYNNFVQLAAFENLHCLLAIQTNREGARVNRGIKKGEDRLLTMEDVSESYGPMQVATTVLTLNRSDIDRANQTMTYYICKTRSSQGGEAVVTKTDFERCRSHGEDLPAIWYQGNVPKAHRVTEQMFKQFNGDLISPSDFPDD